VSNVVKDNNLPRNPGGEFSTDVGINLGYGLAGSAFTNVQTNTVTGSGFDGILACSESGNPCITTDDTIVGNVVRGNGFSAGSTTLGNGQGIRLVAIADTGSPDDFSVSTRITVNGNTVTGNAKDGIVVASRDNMIIGNNAAGNNVLHRSFVFDIDDFSSTQAPNLPECDHNVWQGNTWGPYYNATPSFGPVGYTPYGAYDYECQASGGTGPTPGYFDAPVPPAASPAAAVVQRPSAGTTPVAAAAQQGALHRQMPTS
jgi:parallel beta-helix repeat protein